MINACTRAAYTKYEGYNSSSGYAVGNFLADRRLVCSQWEWAARALNTTLPPHGHGHGGTV